MRRTLFKSKIHNATLTGADLEYQGSIQIDRNLMMAADLAPYEMVHVLNASNGERLVTYVIEGKPGSGEICLNGPAARLGYPGDRVVIISYGEYEEAELADHEPLVVHVDDENRPLRPRLQSESGS
jgi:aspartate 1-decarboxylase